MNFIIKKNRPKNQEVQPLTWSLSEKWSAFLEEEEMVGARVARDKRLIFQKLDLTLSATKSTPEKWEVGRDKRHWSTSTW